MFDTRTRLFFFACLKDAAGAGAALKSAALAPGSNQQKNWLQRLRLCNTVYDFGPKHAMRIRVKEWIEWCAPIALYKRVTVCKWFTQVTRNKRATVSDSLKSLVTREWQERFALFHEQITLSLFRSQQTSKSLEKPMREFPTLEGGAHMGFITLLKQ